MIRYSIEKKYTTLVLVVILLVLGYVSYTGLSIDLFPDLELPMLFVVAQETGQTPEAMELKVTRPLERVLSTSEGLKEMQSFSTSGRSMLLLTFEQGHNMDSASIDVSAKMDLLSELWTTGTRPTVLRLNPSMLPVMISAISTDKMSPEELTRFYEEQLQTNIEGTDGVAQVQATGLFKSEVQILLSEEKIHEKNTELLNRIKSSLEEKEKEIQEAKDKIQEGKDRLSSISISTPSVGIPDNFLDASISLSEELAQLSIKKASSQVYLSSLEQVHLLLTTPAEDLEETQARILQMLTNFPFSLTEENLEEARQWTLEEIEKSKQEQELLTSEETSLRERLEQASSSISSLTAAQGQMMAQAGNMLLQAQAAGAELTKMEVLLESQNLLLESKKEEALATANLSKLLTLDSLQKFLMAENISLPIGYISNEDIPTPLTMRNPLSKDELENLLLVDTGKDALGKIYLKDVATIKNTDNSKEYYAKVNGKNALLINIQKQSLANTSKVSSNLHQTIDELEKLHPGLKISPLMDQGQYIQWVIEAILKNILLGGLFAMLILYFFLRDLRFTLLIALAIPISIVATLVLMYFSNMTLNLVSMAGLALGVGMMVDNSIVVIENIHRLSAKGMDLKQASLEGAKEIAPAITASTMTTAFVFLPIVFTQGVARELFTDMALTIAYALFASLVVALSLIPTASSLQAPRNQYTQREFPFYRKSLLWSLRHPFVILGLSLALLIGSFALLISKGAVFIPAMDTPQIEMTLRPESPSQTKEDLYRYTDEMYKRLEEIPDLSLIGAMDTQGMLDRQRAMSVHLLRDETSTKSSLKLEKELREKLKGLPLDISIQSQSINMDSFGGGGLSLRLLSNDLEEAKVYGEKLLEDMKNIPGLEEVRLGEDETHRQYHLEINREKAMEYKLTPAEIYHQLERRLSLSKGLLTLKEGFSLKVMQEENAQLTRRELMNLDIKNTSGESVKLSEIARLRGGYTEPTLRRINQKRYLEIKGKVASSSNIDLVSQKIDALIARTPPPQGLEIAYAGEREQLTSTMKDLKTMLLLALIIIYGIMIIQFQSLLSPFIVMFTIPLAFTGGALGLLLFGKPLSVIALLGFLVLSGVVVNNGIVFVDTARRGEGPLEEVLLRTGYMRTRPILMTALTTILGLIPLAIAVGLGSEALQPMGLVLIGGLFYATAMTLYVIPVLYKLFHGRKEKTS